MVGRYRPFRMQLTDVRPAAALPALSRWSLGWRVFGSFALALIALAVVGGLAIWQLRLNFVDLQRTAGGTARADQIAYELRVAHLEAHKNLKNALVRGDNPELFRTYAQRFDVEAAKASDARAQLRQLDEYLNDAERAELAVFDRTWPPYVEAWTRAVEAYGGPGGGNIHAADAIMRGKDNDFEDALANLTTSLSDRRRAEARSAMTAVGEIVQRLSLLFGLTTVLAFAVAVFAARGTMRVMRQSGTMAQAAKFRALGQLAGGVAHDVNQSLGIISGYGELAFDALSRPQPDLVKAREGLELITRAAMDAGDTIARLLRFTRAAPDGPAERVEMGDLLGEVAKLTAPRWRDTAQTEGRVITVEVATTGDTAVMGWPSRLREALTNLVLNGVDALPHGGTIRLSARRGVGGVEVTVSDDGVGMPADVRAHVFEPFFTTKGERGTGLGLAVVFGIVEQHGGRITVDSAPGQGTTFAIALPAAPSEVESLAEPIAPTTIRPLRVLALDDEPALARLMALMLRRQGHQVTVAETIAAALQALEADEFDLVVSDLGLGDGMNGWSWPKRSAPAGRARGSSWRPAGAPRSIRSPPAGAASTP